MPAPSRRDRLRRVEETSAGGLVVDVADGGEPRAALIGRLDRRGRLRWSLPKGHVEAGETHEDAAVREVAEETGITGRVRGSARHHRLLVRRRRPAGAQDGAPLPAARPGGELSRRGHRGRAGRVGAARGSSATGWRTTTSAGWSSRCRRCSRTLHEQTGAPGRRRAGGNGAGRAAVVELAGRAGGLRRTEPAPPELVVTLSGLSPIAPQPGRTSSSPEPSATLTGAPVNDPAVQLSIGGPVGSRSEFDDFADDPSGDLPTTGFESLGAATPLASQRLAAGAATAFQITVPASTLTSLLPSGGPWQVRELGIVGDRLQRRQAQRVRNAAHVPAVGTPRPRRAAGRRCSWPGSGHWSTARTGGSKPRGSTTTSPPS